MQQSRPVTPQKKLINIPHWTTNGTVKGNKKEKDEKKQMLLQIKCLKEVIPLNILHKKIKWIKNDAKKRTKKVNFLKIRETAESCVTREASFK